MSAGCSPASGGDAEEDGEGASPGASTGTTGGLGTGGGASGGAASGVEKPLLTGGSASGGTGASTGGSTGAQASTDGWGCKGHDYVVCDDFESLSLDESLWEVESGSVELSSEHAAGGKQSLKVVYDQGKAAPVLRLKTVPSSIREHLFGRVVVWSEEPYPGVQYPGDNYVTQQHVEFFRARSSEPNDYMGYGAGVVGQMRLTSPNDSDVGVGDFVAKKAMCFEWEFDPVRRYAQGFLSVDGVSSGAESPAAGSSDWQLPGGATELTLLQLGIVVITNTTPDMHVWLDEFVLDTKRVGCPM